MRPLAQPSNTVERSLRCGDVALCKITLTICFHTGLRVCILIKWYLLDRIACGGRLCDMRPIFIGLLQELSPVHTETRRIATQHNALRDTRSRVKLRLCPNFTRRARPDFDGSPTKSVGSARVSEKSAMWYSVTVPTLEFDYLYILH